jgi:hypothetical protein
MDIVAAQGLLAETCLLQLSTASRGTLTGAARHKAKKGLMAQRLEKRLEKEAFLTKINNRACGVLAGIMFTDSPDEVHTSAWKMLQMATGKGRYESSEWEELRGRAEASLLWWRDWDWTLGHPDDFEPIEDELESE